MGTPYVRLLDDLVAAPQFRSYELEAASRLAPKSPGGLNIDDGERLIDGVRCKRQKDPSKKQFRARWVEVSVDSSSLN